MKFKLRLLLAGFIVSFLVVATFSIISFLRTSRLSTRVDLVEHSFVVATTISKVNENLLLIDKSAFRFLVTRDSSFLEPLEKAIEHLKTTTDSLKFLTAADKRQEEYLVTLVTDQNLYVRDCYELIRQPMSNASSILSSANFQSNKAKLSTVKTTLEKMAAIEHQLLRKRTEQRKSYLRLTNSIIRTLSIIFSLFTTLLFFLLLREFRRRIRFQAELQQRLSEVAQSKRELEHLAYATSHDLQEPLRKIRILTDKWYNQNKTTLSEENIGILKRVSASATRMHELVGELMVLASLNEDSRIVPCNLGEYAMTAAEQLTDAIEAKQADLRIEVLPTIQGYPEQIKLLFRNLIDNSLKFNKPDRPLVITISGRKADSSEVSEFNSDTVQYQCITVQDNGLGFDNRQTEKMFGIFRQLHSAEEGFAGKGMGLAICQRIMTNHKGHIIAHGFPDEGATFKLYFPVT